MLEALQPKKVGWLLRPRLINVMTLGMEGKVVPFSIVLFLEPSRLQQVRYHQARHTHDWLRSRWRRSRLLLAPVEGGVKEECFVRLRPRRRALSRRIEHFDLYRY